MPCESAGRLWLVAPPLSAALDRGDPHRGGAAYRHSPAPLWGAAPSSSVGGSPVLLWGVCGSSVAGRAHAAEPHKGTAPRPWWGAVTSAVPLP
ncbi:hypothetical protein FPZ41_41605 [Streptomyces sp. K1PN6]|uniref:Uncharacterized protein n=1 Tax=Streptomyces acidicola TaxID=2596892 RepID=A0A5N8X5D2_9ACTN|nr:hypothetical protein [Streptomyces acidicola]